MAPTVVPCDMFGRLKPAVFNGKTMELADLLSTGPTSAPTGEQLSAALYSLPNAEGFARLLHSRWARQTYCAQHQDILDAFAALFESEASVNLKPVAKAFLEDLMVKIKDLVSASASKYGETTGDLYDEVFGEQADKSSIPGYLPAVSHFQLYYHELGNSSALFKAWTSCLEACGTPLSSSGTDGLGSSPAKRAFVYLLSLAQDVSYLRLCQSLLLQSCEFQYA